MFSLKEWFLSSNTATVFSLILLITVLLSWFTLSTSIGIINSIFIGFFLGLITASQIIILKIILLKTRWLESQIKNAKAEVQATHSISRFNSIPHTFEEYEASAQLIRYIIREIYLRKPKLILELGSGSSTSIVAACLKEIGNGRIVSIDHDDFYAEKTRKLLEIEKTHDFAEVITAPLTKYEIDQEYWTWYGMDFEQLSKSSIDMMIVDGPPNKIQKLSRYPAIPLMNSYLSNECLIFFDDTLRKDEKRIVELWERKLDFKMIYENEKNGFVVLQKNHSNHI